MQTSLQNGNDDAFYILIKQVADVADYRYEGLSLLHLACKYGRANIVSYLIEHRLVYACYSQLDCDIHCEDGEGNIPLHYACDGNYRSIIEKMLCSYPSVSSLLDIDPLLLEKRNNRGSTPLDRITDFQLRDQLLQHLSYNPSSRMYLPVDDCSPRMLLPTNDLPFSKEESFDRSNPMYLAVDCKPE